MHTTPVNDALPPILEFIRDTVMRCADRVRVLDEGWSLSTPSIAMGWELNQVRISRQIGFEHARRLLDREQRHLTFRHVVFEPETFDDELSDAFRAAAWRVERDALMELRRQPDQSIDTSAVAEISAQAAHTLSRRWALEERPRTPPGELAQLQNYWIREAEVFGDLRLGVSTGDGTPLAMTVLRRGGDTAQLENVYTVPEARGRGLARALLTRAVQLARETKPALIFIVADAHGWPQQLYRKIGFDAVGELRRFHLEVSNVQPAAGARSSPNS